MKSAANLQATISESYAHSWNQMWKQFLPLLLVIILISFAHLPNSVFQDIEYSDASPGMIVLELAVAVYFLLVFSVLSYGADLLFLRAMRTEKIEIKEIFGGFRKNYLNIVLTNLFTIAIIGLGFVFLIIPGIILACRLAFVPYLVMDKQLDPVAAIEKSWSMTKGHGWKIFGMAVLAVPIFIAGVLCLFVGVFFAWMWISGAFAALYYAVDSEERALFDDEEEPDMEISIN
jgi:uncharacterized membrane protein